MDVRFRAAMAKAEPAMVDVHGARWTGRHEYELVPSAKRYELYEMSYAAKVSSLANCIIVSMVIMIIITGIVTIMTVIISIYAARVPSLADCIILHMSSGYDWRVLKHAFWL